MFLCGWRAQLGFADPYKVSCSCNIPGDAERIGIALNKNSFFLVISVISIHCFLKVIINFNIFEIFAGIFFSRHFYF